MFSSKKVDIFEKLFIFHRRKWQFLEKNYRIQKSNSENKKVVGTRNPSFHSRSKNREGDCARRVSSSQSVKNDGIMAPTTFAHIARRQPAAAGTLFAGANRLRPPEQRRAAPRRAAYGGSKHRPRRSGGSPPRAWPTRPLRCTSRPRRPSGLPPRAWPTRPPRCSSRPGRPRPVATAGDAD